MAENKEYTYEVNELEFNDKVIEASHTSVVLVDFWASWCGPCRMLEPVLEKVVQSYGGRVLLARLNVDENQELAAQFGIRSIPCVKIFKDGSMVREFIGALPENEITAIMKSIVGDESSEALSRAGQLLQEHRFREAESIYTSMLEKNPEHPGALVGIAKLAIRDKRYNRARKLLNSVGELEKEYEEAQLLLSGIDFHEVCNKAGGLDNCKKSVKKNPADLDMQYTLGCCYAVSERYPEAFETFLTVIKSGNQRYKETAKNAMVSLFTIVGQDSEITGTYRDLLARELF